MKKQSSCLLVLIVISAPLISGCTEVQKTGAPVTPATTTGIASGPSAEPGTAIVRTDAGQVAGINQDDIRVYHGIPFAAPPTGELRWRPPAPVQPWTGVKEVKEYSETCPQAEKAGAAPSPGTPALNMSEDCLYLNVWTPATGAGEKLPVMVFFYGGGFTGVAGSGGSRKHSGSLDLVCKDREPERRDGSHMACLYPGERPVSRDQQHALGRRTVGSPVRAGSQNFFLFFPSFSLPGSLSH